MPNYVPIRDLANEYGARVDWDPETREVLVNQQRIKPSYISPEGRAYAATDAINALLSNSAANQPAQTAMYAQERQPVQQYNTGDSFLDTLLHNVQLYQSPLQKYPSGTPTFAAKQAEDAKRADAAANEWAKAIAEAELTGMWKGQPTWGRQLQEKQLALAARSAMMRGGGGGGGGLSWRELQRMWEIEDAFASNISASASTIAESPNPGFAKDALNAGILKISIDPRFSSAQRDFAVRHLTEVYENKFPQQRGGQAGAGGGWKNIFSNVSNWLFPKPETHIELTQRFAQDRKAHGLP